MEATVGGGGGGAVLLVQAARKKTTKVVTTNEEKVLPIAFCVFSFNTSYAIRHTPYAIMFFK